MNIENLIPGSIHQLFPNLGMTVYSQGCKCELLGVDVSNGATVRVVDNFQKGPYQVGQVLNCKQFAIESPAAVNPKVEREINFEDATNEINNRPFGHI